MRISKLNLKLNFILKLAIIFIVISSNSLKILIVKENIHLNLHSQLEFNRDIPKGSGDDAEFFIDGSRSNNLSSYYPYIQGSGSELDPYILTNIQFNSSFSGNNLYLKNIHSYFHIKDLHFSNFKNSSCNIRIDRSENTIVSNCSFNSVMFSLFISSCSNITIFNNSIMKSNTMGILLISCNNISITKNTISSIYEGLLIQICESILIDSNQFLCNTRHALVSVSSNSNMIFHNDFINNKNAIILVDSQRCIIDQNYFHNNKRTAIALYKSDFNNISSNYISKSYFGVAFEFPWSDPEGMTFSSRDKTHFPKRNILFNNTMTQITLKPIKYWLGDNISSHNKLEQNFWSAFLFILSSILTLAGITFLTLYSIRKHREIKRILKSYEEKLNQKEKIKTLEKELEEYKRKFFELNSKLNLD